MLRSLPHKLLKGFARSPEDRLRRARLIACDLDGTLLNRYEMIAPETAAMIKAIESLGIPFVLITRRHHRAVEPFGDVLRMAEPVISLDGALIRNIHAEEPIDMVPLDQEFALDIADEIEATSDVECSMVTPDAFLTLKGGVHLPSHHQHWNIQTVTLPDFDAPARQGIILEVIASGSYHAVNGILHYVEEKMRPGELKLRLYESHSQSDHWYLEVRSAAATKYDALVRLIRRYGIALTEVVGIGDHYNDVDFCRKSGYVVAPKNAVKEMKEIADFITARDCTEQGIDEFLAYFLRVRGVEIDPDDLNPPTPEKRRRSR
jgi:Cof subfamily protein (haloacid dehalogenase superfamily)